MITLLNTSILTSYGDYDYTPLSLKDAKQMLKTEPFQSAVGHAATADIMSLLLDTRVKLNRINYEQEIGDKAIVFKLKSRLEEGKILTVPEIEEIGYEWGLLVKKDANLVPYDSEADTLKHIKRVNELLGKAACILVMRGNVHDNSKLASPEKELFDEYTPILKTLTYGTDEYKESLAKLKPALDHHYANNSHHPEYHDNGINGMNLFDIFEMLLDWKAATERTQDGDIMKSIDINEKRFNMSPQLAQIFRNTAIEMGWDNE